MAAPPPPRSPRHFGVPVEVTEMETHFPIHPHPEGLDYVLVQLTIGNRCLETLQTFGKGIADHKDLSVVDAKDPKLESKPEPPVYSVARSNWSMPEEGEIVEQEEGQEDNQEWEWPEAEPVAEEAEDEPEVNFEEEELEDKLEEEEELEENELSEEESEEDDLEEDPEYDPDGNG
ncbi:proline-, glutamic acid- and leucine-rich protein 1-like [Eucalyptus grandis]|uniref:proline-, glutamic acid- and leucine-rich protein 1-like n=1 Tax=Eucalyptus grandis TaxID=71139 RepID=UPI00192EB53C|nr:proline-, glutamic acid- and leucine-rich protein 1-like [Eucalyptus grandis]